MKRSLAIAGIAGLSLAAGAFAAVPTRPVVVELFTSQGSSACLPADKLLYKLAKRNDVVVLTLPVTYWDMLGWKDTLAREAYTARQNAYAATRGHSGIFTPQIVVDGVVSVVGSREGDVDAAIGAAKDQARLCTDVRHAAPSSCSIPVAIEALGTDRLAIRLGAAPTRWRKANVEATVWLLSLRHSVSVRVDGGENKGRKLKYRNVVDALQAVGVWKGAEARFDVPYASAKYSSKDGVVVLLQLSGGGGRIVGAAYRGNTETAAKP